MKIWQLNSEIDLHERDTSRWEKLCTRCWILKSQRLMELFEVKQEPTNHCENLLLIFLRRHTNVIFLTEINIRFMKRKIILGYNIFWDSRSDTFCGFKSFWSNLFRDSFVERKLWFILPFRQRQRICFTKRNVLTYFPIISRCWIENVIVSISWTCCFPKKSIYCCFVVFPRFLIEIEGRCWFWLPPTSSRKKESPPAKSFSL